MIDIRANFKGGLNLDDSLYTVPKNSYIDALNVTRDAIEGSNDNALTNIVGNQLIANFLFPGNNKCIGAIPNTLRNTVIFFIWNSNQNHLICEYDNTNNIIVPIFSNLLDSGGVDVLGFTEDGKINSINIYNRNIEEGEGDLLYFLDSLGRPTVIDIARFKAGEYNPVTREILDVAKRPSLFPPNCIYGNDLTRTTNSLRDRLFRFKYRYIYDNNEKSTCSPISTVPLPFNILQDDYTNIQTNNNKIDLYFNTGDKDVKAVELLMSYVNKTNDWSDFALIDVVTKAEINLLSATYNIVNNANDSLVTITFQGAIIEGIEIYITINDITGTYPIVTPLASYITVAGDTITDILNALQAQITGSSIGGNNSLSFSYSTNSYEFVPTNLNIILPPGSSVDNSLFYYSFYNEGAYPYIDINESIQLFDYVPELANAQEMPNGNVLLYGGITEGYDKLQGANVVNTVLTRQADNIPSGNLTGTWSFLPNSNNYKQYYITFSGSCIAGTVISLNIDTTSGVQIASSYTTTVDNESIFSIYSNLAINSNPTWVYQVEAFPNLLYLVLKPTNSFSNIIIVQPALTVYNSIPTFLFSTQRKLGIAYFDKTGKTNGIAYTGELTFPAYDEDPLDTLLLPYINTKIYHQPPIWANSFGFYLTKEATQFLYWECIDVKWGSNPTQSLADYLYFDISNLQQNQKEYPTTTSVLSYSFQEGDRLRLVKEAKAGGVVFTDDYDAEIVGQVINPIIQGSTPTTGTFIKIKNFAPFKSADFSNNKFIIQLYRNLQQEPSGANEVYYEFGQQYGVGDAGLSTRYHMGNVVNQQFIVQLPYPFNDPIPAEFNFYDGDVYFRPRIITLSTSSTITGSATYNCLDRNFLDNYNSAVNSVQGRPNVIDVNARRAYYGALVRFSEAYQANTNINGTNRFYPNNFDDYDYTYGDVMRFKVRDRFMRVFQRYKVGQVPLYNQILKEQTKESLVVTDRLLNPIQYYIGDVGIGDNAESLASYNYADYFTSNVKGMVCRVSNDGVKYISIDRNVDSWATENIPLRTGVSKIYGAFDQRLGNYVIALENADTPSGGISPAQTLLYDENGNAFDTFVSYHPEMMTTLGTLFISFKNGNLYTHNSPIYNNFYGVQYDSNVTFVFNENALDRKTFMSVAQVSSNVWAVPEIKTDINSYSNIKMQSNLVESDFALLEGSYEAAILRDQNSIGGLLEGDSMKGKLMTMKFNISQPTSLVSLNLVSLRYINSPLNSR